MGTWHVRAAHRMCFLQQHVDVAVLQVAAAPSGCMRVTRPPVLQQCRALAYAAVSEPARHVARALHAARAGPHPTQSTCPAHAAGGPGSACGCGDGSVGSEEAGQAAGTGQPRLQPGTCVLGLCVGWGRGLGRACVLRVFVRCCCRSPSPAAAAAGHGVPDAHAVAVNAGVAAAVGPRPACRPARW